MFKFKPGLIQIVGPTGAGKTQLCIDILQHYSTCFVCTPKQIVYCYDRYEDIYDTFSGYITKFVKGFPTVEIQEKAVHDQNTLLILDDLGSHSQCSQELYKLATIHARKCNLYVMSVSHNLYSKSKYYSDLSANTQYLLLFQNPRYTSQISKLGSQMFPGQSKFFLDSYKKATASDSGYLCIDLTPRTEHRLLMDLLNV